MHEEYRELPRLTFTNAAPYPEVLVLEMATDKVWGLYGIPGTEVVTTIDDCQGPRMTLNDEGIGMIFWPEIIPGTVLAAYANIPGGYANRIVRVSSADANLEDLSPEAILEHDIAIVGNIGPHTAIDIQINGVDFYSGFSNGDGEISIGAFMPPKVDHPFTEAHKTKAWREKRAALMLEQHKRQALLDAEYYQGEPSTWEILDLW